MCDTGYELYQLDKTGYRGHQFGVMKVLHEIERIKLHRRNFVTKHAISVAGYMLGHRSQNKKQAKPFHTDG
jgi:hypothetical protein